MAGSPKSPETGLKAEGVVEAFSSTIVSYRLSKPDDLNARLLDVADDWRAEDPEGIGVTTINGWHSARTLFQRKDAAVRELAQHITLALVSYVRRYIPDYDPVRRKSVTEEGVNIIGQGGFNVPHTHDQFQVSGCYYVSVPDTAVGMSGAIEFLNPVSAVPAVDELGHKMLPDHFRVWPKPGQLLIFPATLSHWVMPNQEQQERVSIAFNLRVMD